MFRNLLNKVIGDPNEKELDRIRPLVEEINALEPTYLWMTNEELRSQTDRLRTRLRQGETLDDILPDAFALVRETAKRTVGMRPFDVQLIGGVVLHEGRVAEMKTGEGKTLVATLPIYLNALTGKGAHLVTVNDYLARRDAVWMGPVYQMLGLSVGLLQQSNKSFLFEPGYTKSEFKDLRPIPRGEAYAADITYGTNHEFGFDYLRDNLAYSISEQVQRPLHYAIVDEVDNVFIDEARTPLIISGASEENDEEYRRFARVARKLEADVDFEVDEKARNVFLTEAGLAKVEELANIDNIYDPVNQNYIHYMEQAVKAHVLFQEGVDYIRQRDRIVLVDEHTGRLMPDRRLSDGLHQSIEAKHGLKVRARMVTQATVTIQNYFRMYPKLAGMTGTALSEAEELYKIYNLEVVVIPTNKPTIRDDAADVVYRTQPAKMQAIVEEIRDAHERGQPILVGTTSVEKSEELSRQLRAHRIEHHVLNAKEHEREGRVIARAGEPGKVTVATNMAGRGVDIKLGGDLPDEIIDQAQRVLRQRGIDPFEATPEQFDTAVAEVDPDYALKREKVLAAGGLYVLGTERHDARRIDNQLRGRSGRQGEPGLSRFFLSLEDDLMRRFGGTNVSNLMAKLGVEDDMPIEHGLVSKSIESAQSRVEGHNFDIRKHLLEYDDVMNQQRETIYSQRQRILTKDDLWPDLWAMIDAEIEKRRGELGDQPGRAWELVNFYDVIMPLNYAPVQIQKGGKGKRGKAPGSAVAYESMRYPYTLSAVRSVFLPFSLTFLAQELAQGAAGDLKGTFLTVAERAIQLYRDYVMEQAIGDSFAQADARYDEGWEQQRELLEQRIMTYLDMIEEREREFNPREMLDQVQRGLPVKLSVPYKELSDMDVDDIRALFEGALEQTYHISTCDQLVRRVAGQVPASLGLAAAQIDLIDPDTRRRILEQAQERTYNEDASRRLAQMSHAGGEQGGKKGDRSLFGWLSRILSLARLDLIDLEEVLREVVANRYDAWAGQTLNEIRDRSNEKLRGEDETAVGQWLLDVLGIVDPQTFRLNWRIPPSFLVIAQTADMSSDEQNSAFREHLQQCVAERQAVWGEAEFARHSQQRLLDLGASYFEALTRFWGRRIIGDSDIPVTSLPIEHLDALERLITVYDLREQQIGTWPMFDAVAEGLGKAVESRLLPDQRPHDQQLLDALESILLERGEFDDATAEAQFMEGRLVDLSRAEREELAAHLGEEMLNPLRPEKISALEPALQKRVIDLLASRGRFTDEKRVRDFLIHQRLNDIGVDEAGKVCRQLAVDQLDRERGRTIAELELSMRDQVMRGLQVNGFLWDDEAKEQALTQPLSHLTDDARDALARVLGAEEWPDGKTVDTLENEVRSVVREVLDDAGLFLMRDRLDSFSLADLSDLPGDLRDTVHEELRSQLRSHLTGGRGRDLPPLLYKQARGYLEDSGFFLDAGKVAQLELRSISSLDGKSLTAIERTVGSEILSKVDQRKFINLDKEMRETILRYLDHENIYRKSSKRRAFMQRPLAELDKAIYDGIAQHLGRGNLANVRSQSIGSLPAELRTLVKQQVQSAGDLLDSAKINAFGEDPLDTLPTGVREELFNHLDSALDALFADKVEQEVYDGLLSDARRFLTEQGYFTRDGAEEEFAALKPETLDAGIRDEVHRALGRCILEPVSGLAADALPASLRERVLMAINHTEIFVDEGKQRTFLYTRLLDLTPLHREAIVTYLGSTLHREIGDLPVSSLKEETRQSLRQYLDDSGYFVDQALVQSVEEQPLAALRREDWQALISALGGEKLGSLSEMRISDIEPATRETILAHLRSKGRFLDDKRREDFRRRGLAALSEDKQQEAVNQAREVDRQRLKVSTLANLPDLLRWEVENLAIDGASPADTQRMRGIERGTLAQLESDLHDALLRYLGYPHTRTLREKRLADLSPVERLVIRDFLGDRVALDIQKRVMLSFVSRLWIDYLTDMEDLRQGIGLEAFGQRDPLVEYKRRAYQMFQQLIEEIRQGIISRVFALEPIELQVGTNA